MNKNSTILIVGHDDIIESSLYSYFELNRFNNVFSSSQIALNTTIQASVYDFFQRHRPEYVFLSSVRSGGIEANQKFGAEFIYENLESQNNILYAANKFGVKKLLYFASSCVYPKECPQPMTEEYLHSGKMEPTSLPYSTAKLAGIELCRAFRKQHGLNAIVAIPATIYGAQQDYNTETAHVIGALIERFSNAVGKGVDEVVLWGTGNPKREFLHAEDFVSASIFLMEKYSDEKIVNIGLGEDISIKDLAAMIADVFNYKGEILFDTTKPDGTMQKLLDSSLINSLGWQPKIELAQGIKKIAVR